MGAAAATLAILVLFGLGLQIFQSLNLVRIFRAYRPVGLSNDEFPSCAVVLCLRGCDPGLAENIENLLDQEYPDFHLYFVVDSNLDPAVAVVQQVLADRPGAAATLRVVEPATSECSLIANHHSIVLPELAQQYEFLALVDADAATWPKWLRTLVTPLVNSELSIVYGNRWYMPTSASVASLTRFIWNYGSVQQMVFFQYPWGGSLAMKGEFALLPEFSQALRKSFGNDTPMFALAKSAGMKVAFHPGMMLINQEKTRFLDFFRWMIRQLLHGRLYHPTWPIVLGTGAVTAVVIVLSMIVNSYNLIVGDWNAVLILTSALAAYWFVWVAFVFHLDHTVSRLIRDRGGPKRWWTLATAMKICLVAPLVQCVYLAGMLSVITLRRVSWRGVDYEINGPFKVRMMNYRPYTVNVLGDETIL
ncbi:MAG: cellulose synthase/poly-beta-1,6-N-acetylglucosamine synthase-like glycosyltransferase [Mariniblastus sp.]|jgi:cellulose synthase/poly-beta-1,6-N-acetylglucosamine synthase-like glycosyltransferase